MTQTMKVLLAGDTFPVTENIPLFQEGNTETLFGKRVCELFQTADYSICNLEGCLTDTGVPIDKIGPSVKAPTDTLKALSILGIKAATLANTHTLDFGRQGHDEMRNALSQYNIDYFGTGDHLTDIQSHITINRNGVTVTFYTVTELFSFNTPADNYPGAKGYDEYIVCRDIAELKKHCDHLVVLYHGGAEITHYNTPMIRRRFHRMADNGADIIISQHTHAVGLEEHYHNAYFLYGQGNFCFNLGKNINDFNGTGILLEIEFRKYSFSVHKHLIRRTEKGCLYDEKQDFSDFEERSRLHDRLLQGDKEAAAIFDNEFDRICQLWSPRLIRVFRGENPQDEQAIQNMTSAETIHYLLSQYSKRQLMSILMMLTNDEFHEIAVGFIQTAIKEKEG